MAERYVEIEERFAVLCSSCGLVGEEADYSDARKVREAHVCDLVVACPECPTTVRLLGTKGVLPDGAHAASLTHPSHLVVLHHHGKPDHGSLSPSTPAPGGDARG